MGAQGAVNLLYKKELEKENSAARSTQLVDEYKEKFANPYVAAELGYVDDVIHPHETRKFLIAALEIQQNKRVERPARKHGNIPL
jgi:propionyl-CoA carboxylase beta chain